MKLLFLKNDEPFLASQSSRKLALEFVFGRLQYTSFDLSSKIRDVHQERKDVKDVIKFACLLDDPLCSYCRKQPKSRAMTIREGCDSNVLFQFLEGLPNLHSLQLGHFIRPVEFSQACSPS